MTAKDPLAAALDAAVPPPSAGINKVEHLFGDRPQVLQSIINARQDRKLTYSQIARLLSSEGVSIKGESVKTFLVKKGIQ